MTEREALRKALASNPKMAREMMKMVETGKMKAGPPDDNEELQVLCMRWPGMFDGCTKEKCMACGQDVAVAPSTRDMVKNHKAAVYYTCMVCVDAGALTPLH